MEDSVCCVVLVGLLVPDVVPMPLEEATSEVLDERIVDMLVEPVSVGVSGGALVDELQVCCFGWLDSSCVGDMLLDGLSDVVSELLDDLARGVSTLQAIS